MRSGRVAGVRTSTVETEAIEQLRPQLALLRVAGADQHEPGGMANGEALALDDILAGLGDVE